METDLDALVAETIAFARAANAEAQRPRAEPREIVERIGLDALDFGGPEREQIRKRVENFRRHQQQLMREREEYAATALRKMRFSLDR